MVVNSNFSSLLSLDSVYGPGAASKVREAHVLVVGAGGVGCELVKNLALSGFGTITLIDLDTIDVSNLNRQFLFRRNHVGKSKATEAAASIRAMVPGTNIHAVTGNIKEARFGVVFFKRFTLVCNALDNLEARRHVNRMCLAAEIPLIESGSTGYNGQCSVIGKGVECYDCVERPPQKSYAVCTIRSTPDKPVHCVVWAKFLYDLIFGADDDGNVLRDLDGGPTPAVTEQNGVHTISVIEKEQNHSVIEKQRQKLKTIPKRVRYMEWDTPDSFSKRVCDRVFVDDINEQRAMKDLWTDRAPPLAYDVNKVVDDNVLLLGKVNLLDQAVWTKEKSAAIFKATLQRIVHHRHSEIGALSFDKDDRDAMMFVASAANLRAHAYGVPLQSPFSAKGIAGNIIHAIATTNAMVGGLIVLEALKITTADGDLSKSVTTYVSKAPRGSRAKKMLCPESLRPPNPKCFVCSKGQLHLSVDVERTTLQAFVDFVLQKKMSIIHPGVHVTTGEFHNTLYESGDGLEEDEVEIYAANLMKTLQGLRVENGSQLVVEDFAQNVRCTIHVTHVDKLLDENSPEDRFILNGDIPLGNKTVPEKEDDATEDVDSIEEVELSKSLAIPPETVTGKKRGIESEVAVNGAPEAKKTLTVCELQYKGDSGANTECMNSGDCSRFRSSQHVGTAAASNSEDAPQIRLRGRGKSMRVTLDGLQRLQEQVPFLHCHCHRHRESYRLSCGEVDQAHHRHCHQVAADCPLNWGVGIQTCGLGSLFFRVSERTRTVSGRFGVSLPSVLYSHPEYALYLEAQEKMWPTKPPHRGVDDVLTATTSNFTYNLGLLLTAQIEENIDRTTAPGILMTGGAIAGSLLAALYAFQERILYHPSIPSREYEKNPGEYGMEYEDVDILTEDRVKIHAWLIKQHNPKDAATFLYFHGNAGNLSHRLPDVRYFFQSGFNILMVSYRGYGTSEGFPSEKGIKLDALAALEYARDRNDTLDTNRIYLFGRSIGAACAIALASSPKAQETIRGLVIENTFTSIDDMIDYIMPALTFAKPFNRNKWNSQVCIREIEVPILFISGLRDELCPPQHMKELHESAVKARFKVMHTVLTGSHNDTWWAGGPLYRAAIRDFLQRIEGGE